MNQLVSRDYSNTSHIFRPSPISIPSSSFSSSSIRSIRTILLLHHHYNHNHHCTISPHHNIPQYHTLTTRRGKGTPRRKVKKVTRTAGADDKKLQAALKKMNVQPIQGIEEVNMFKEDGNVIHFANPRGKSTFPTLSSLFELYQILILMPYSPRLRPLQHLRPLR